MPKLKKDGFTYFKVSDSDRWAFSECHYKIEELIENGKPIPPDLYKEFIAFFKSDEAEQRKLFKNMELAAYIDTLKYFKKLQPRYYTFSGKINDEKNYSFDDMVFETIIVFTRSCQDVIEDNMKVLKKEKKRFLLHTVYSLINKYTAKYLTDDQNKKFTYYQRTVVTGYILISLGIPLLNGLPPLTDYIHNAVKDFIKKALK